MNLAREIEQQSSDFEQWSECLNEYWYTIANANTLSEEAYTKAHIAFLDVQNVIAKFVIRNSRAQEDFESTPYFYAFPFGQETLFRSRKQQEDYKFGIFGEEFYIETYITNPLNIKHMPDEFWAIFMETMNYGDFCFQENASPINKGDDSPRPELLRAARSSIYKMIRNCLFLEQWAENSVPDLGWFKVSWPTDTPWKDLLEKGTHAFRCLYRLNYMLYRYDYQRQKAQEKRAMDRPHPRGTPSLFK